MINEGGSDPFSENDSGQELYADRPFGRKEKVSCMGGRRSGGRLRFQNDGVTEKLQQLIVLSQRGAGK
jgi:hypothetical protein